MAKNKKLFNQLDREIAECQWALYPAEYDISYPTASVDEWLRAWDTLTMFEATVCGRSWVQSPTGAI